MAAQSAASAGEMVFVFVMTVRVVGPVPDVLEEPDDVDVDVDVDVESGVDLRLEVSESGKVVGAPEEGGATADATLTELEATDKDVMDELATPVETSADDGGASPVDVTTLPPAVRVGPAGWAVEPDVQPASSANAVSTQLTSTNDLDRGWRTTVLSLAVARVGRPYNDKRRLARVTHNLQVRRPLRTKDTLQQGY